MATKNFGIVGVGSDVQFGKGGARLISNGSALAAVLSNSTANAVSYAPLLIGTPTSSNHAATVGHVDETVANVAQTIWTALGTADNTAYSANISASYIGGATSFSGADDLLDAALKGVADAVIYANGSVAFTNAVSMGGFQVYDLGAPTIATDAANKEYVDGVFAGLGNLFDYTGVVAGSTDRNAPFDLATLTKTTAGSYYKISTTGWFVLNGTELYGEAGEGWIFTDSGEVSRVTQDDNTLLGTANFVTVVGSTVTGYTIDLASAFKSRVSNAETALSALTLTVGNVQAEIDTIETAVSLLANGAYTANTDTNYIGTVATVQGALEALDRTLAEVVARPTDILVSADESVSVHAVGNNVVTLGTVASGLELTFSNGVTVQATGTAADADITLAPTGNGVISTNNARLSFLANPTDGTDAVNLNTLEAHPMMRMAGKAIAATGGTIAANGKVMKIRVEITQAYPSTAAISVTRDGTTLADSTAEIDPTTVGTYAIDVMNDAGSAEDIIVTVDLDGEPYVTGQGSVWVEWSTTYAI